MGSFLPEQYKVKDFGGDVMAADLVPAAFQEGVIVAQYGQASGGIGIGHGGGAAGGVFGAPAVSAPAPTYAGQLGGVVTDPSGAVIPGAHVIVSNPATGYTASAVTDSNGRWLVSNVPAGRTRITADARGFKTLSSYLSYDAGAEEHPITLSVGTAAETVEVNSESSTVNTITDSEIREMPLNGRNAMTLQQLEVNAKKRDQNAASENVINLQRRVSGVLPVAVEVPRAGTSFQFVRPLVLDEETKVTFTYKSK